MKSLRIFDTEMEVLIFSYSFSPGEDRKITMLIDTGNKVRNKEIFDLLLSEGQDGVGLWQRAILVSLILL
jgi:hypothetical protein